MQGCRCSLSLRAVMTIIVVCLYATVAHAFATGVTTLSFGSTGCNLCHFGGMVPTVQLGGPAQVDPGSTNEYTLQIGAVGNQNKGGLNVSAPAGVLTTGGSDAADTQVLIGAGNLNEITQTSAKAAVDGTVTFTFLWTAPSSGSVTLTAWGNAVNGNFRSSGDLSASSDLTISVGNSAPTETPTPTASPTPTAIPCVGDCDGSGDVTVDEIILLINIDLGTADAAVCPNGIPSGDDVDVTLIIQAVNNDLNGCGGG